MGASDKIVKLMQYKPKINTKGGIRIPPGDCVGELEIKDVNFSYPSKPDVKVIKNVSIQVKKNQVIALVG